MLLSSCETPPIRDLNPMQVWDAGNKIAATNSASENDWPGIDCIAIGDVKDVSSQDDFLHLDKETLLREALYGHLAPRRYRDVELSRVDVIITESGLDDIPGLLRKLKCDGLLRAKITRFSNEFYVTYSATSVGLNVELVDVQDQVIWSSEKTVRSDAGTIPISPIGLATGLFFATRNKTDEIAFQMIDSVVRQSLQSLPARRLKEAVEQRVVASEVPQDFVSAYTYEDVVGAINKGNFRDALVKAERLISIDDADHRAYFLAGKAALGLGESSRSESFFLSAIGLEGGNHQYYNGLGLAYSKDRRMELARQFFLKAIVIENRDPVAHLGIAESYELEKNYEKAADYYYLSGTSSVTKKDYGSALRSLAALERLPKGSERIEERSQQLRKIISFNRRK